MSSSGGTRKDGPRRGAQSQFDKMEQRADLARKEREVSQAADAAKIVKLRALRLAKEEADASAAAAQIAVKPKKKAVKRIVAK